MKTRQWVLEIAVLLAGLLFFFTAAVKLADMHAFTQQISNQVFAPVYTPYLTWGLPLAELLVTVLLVWPKTRVYGFAVFTCMMLVFTAYVVLVLNNYFGRIPCECATAFKDLSWKTHRLINILFTLLGAAGLILQLIENRTQKQQGDKKYSLREDQEKAENLKKRVSIGQTT